MFAHFPGNVGQHFVAAFQFHPEMSKDGVLKLVEKHEDVFDKNYPFIQSRDEIVKTDNYFEINIL